MTKLTIKIAAAALAVSAAFALTGCKSSADRMYECEAHGVSRDACYVAEQNRTATLNAQAQAQAYRNASDLYGAKGTETKRMKAEERAERDDEADDLFGSLKGGKHHHHHHDTQYDEPEDDDL